MKTERELFLYELNGHGYTFENTTWLGGCFEDDFLNMAWEMWCASAQREGYKLVPVEMSRKKAKDMSNKYWRDYQYSHEVYQQGQSATALSIESARINWCRNKAHEIMREYKTLIDAAS